MANRCAPLSSGSTSAARKISNRLAVCGVLAFDLIGVRPTVELFAGGSEVNWLVNNQPDIWKETYKFTYLSGFLVHQLTGQFVDSIGSQVGYMPFDYKKQDWAAPPIGIGRRWPLNQINW